jgi:plasmid stabilization system protein ParE
VAAEWLAAARADLARIFAFNLGRSEAYAERVEARLIERADSIGRTPAMGRPVGKSGLRALSIVDAQYVIIYALVDGRILIFRVRSTRENTERP